MIKFDDHSSARALDSLVFMFSLIERSIFQINDAGFVIERWS